MKRLRAPEQSDSAGASPAAAASGPAVSGPANPLPTAEPSGDKAAPLTQAEGSGAVGGVSVEPSDASQSACPSLWCNGETPAPLPSTAVTSDEQNG